MKLKIFFILAIIVFGMAAGRRIYRFKSVSAVSPSGRLNIAVYGGNAAWLLAVDTRGEENLHGVFLPGKIYVETARGAGKYPIGKLGKLGGLEGDFLVYIRESFERFMQVPVDGVIVAGAGRAEKMEDLKKVFGLPDLVVDQREKTDLGVWDRFIVWKTLRSAVLAKDTLVDISQTRAVREELQPDGTKVLVADVALLPIKIRQFFIEPQLAEEKQNIVVLNATRTEGLAQIAAEMVESIGLNVVKLGNAEQILSVCEIRANERAGKTKSFARLRQVFDCDVGGRGPQQQIGEIEIYMGEEFSGKMFGG